MGTEGRVVTTQKESLWEDINGIGGESIRAATVENFSVLPVLAIWECPCVAICAIFIIVIPIDPSLIKTCNIMKNSKDKLELQTND